MCRECNQNPCHPKCPNAKPEEPVYTCWECDSDIYEDDMVTSIPQPDDSVNYYCEDCIASWTREAENFDN